MASAAMTTWLYTRNLLDGHLFDILARDLPNGTTNENSLRASWWANYHYHPSLAILCVSVGSIGVYYALRAAWLYLKLGGVLIATRKAVVQNMEFSYVPRWRDQSYGWSPVTGALFVIYMSTINFAVSMVAVYDMLENKAWTLGVAVFFVTLGVVSNLLIISGSFFRMLAAHKGVEERLRALLIQVAQASPGRPTDFENVYAASDLSAWRSIPVANFGLTVIKILPGIYALVEFIRTFFFLRH